MGDCIGANVSTIAVGLNEPSVNNIGHNGRPIKSAFIS